MEAEEPSPAEKPITEGKFTRVKRQIEKVNQFLENPIVKFLKFMGTITALIIRLIFG